MAKRVAALARSQGALATIETDGLPPPGTKVEIVSERGLRLQIEFRKSNGFSTKGVKLLTWTVWGTDAFLSETFLPVRDCGSTVHRDGRGASILTYGFEGPIGVMGIVERGLNRARDGSAFDLQRELCNSPPMPKAPELMVAAWALQSPREGRSAFPRLVSMGGKTMRYRDWIRLSESERVALVIVEQRRVWSSYLANRFENPRWLNGRNGGPQETALSLRNAKDQLAHIEEEAGLPDATGSPLLRALAGLPRLVDAAR